MKNLSCSYELNSSMDVNDSRQIINYRDTDIDDVNANTTVLVTGNQVSIVPSSGNHSIGSSKVKLKNVVDYSWEHKFYEGQILAIHISGMYIAYGIQGKDSGIIRVVNLKSSERALIKGIEGMTQDVAFAFIMQPILLACIDSVGIVYVYQIEENKLLNTLSCQLTLQINHDSSEKLNKINRIVWCPFVPDEEEALEEDDPSKLIITRGNKAHLWTVNIIRAKHGLNPVTPSSVTEGFFEIEVDHYTIVDVAFSPDGSTVALACSDGGVRFFQVDVQEGQSPVCIHDWRPHDNKPVSCLYFLDNHLDPDCHFWKFAVTGVEGNTELKLWTCETWTCLQTIKYEPVDHVTGAAAKLKVAVDITANFILISDMQRKLLHVLQLKKNKEETEMRVHIISEFLLSSPILSFGIVKARADYFTDEALLAFENSTNIIQDNDCSRTAIDADENLILRTMIKLYLVQPKALHECIIVYNPEETSNKFTNPKFMTKNLYADVVEKKLLNGLKDNNEASIYPTNDYGPEDSFVVEDCTMTRRLQEFLENKDVRRRSVERENITHQINTVINKDQNQVVEEVCELINQNENGVAVVSTGSSPSREVQNIMFSSQVSGDNMPDITVKASKSELPSTVWPKVPIPEPEILCQKMDNILRNAGLAIHRMEDNDMKKYDDCSINVQAALTSMFSKMEVLESRFSQLNESVKNDMLDVKQTLNALNQYLLTKKDEDKKKQRISNEDDRYSQDRLVAAISQNVNSMIGSEVEYLIKQEISSSVLPSLKNTMDTFGQQLQLKLQQHLNMADEQLKDYIIKTVHKKSVTDALANTLASVLPKVISNSFTEVFCNVILPKFEKSCNEMFQQVDNSFIDGTKDFVNVLQNNVRSYEEKQCSLLQHKMDEFMVRLNDVAKNTSFSTVKNLEPQLLNAVQKLLDEQKKYLEVCILHASKTSTPIIMNVGTKTQEQIEFLLTQGKIEDAIEQVLSASDLKLLIHMCEKLDPDKLFNEPCMLQQHILLSFIQQLSVDFNIQTDLKHKFIEGAVLSLDKKHPVCEKNIPRILPAVRARIAQYINSNPNNKNTRNMKMLLMAVDSLLSDKNEM